METENTIALHDVSMTSTTVLCRVKITPITIRFTNFPLLLHAVNNNDDFNHFDVDKNNHYDSNK